MVIITVVKEKHLSELLINLYHVALILFLYNPEIYGCGHITPLRFQEKYLGH